MGNHHPKQPPVATFTQRLNFQVKLNDVGAFEEANKMGMHCLIYGQKNDMAGFITEKNHMVVKLSSGATFGLVFARVFKGSVSFKAKFHCFKLKISRFEGVRLKEQKQENVSRFSTSQK